MCFPVNFTKFLRTPFFTEHLWTTASDIWNENKIRNSEIECFYWNFKLLVWSLIKSDSKPLQRWRKKNELIKLTFPYNQNDYCTETFSLIKFLLSCTRCLIFESFLYLICEYKLHKKISNFRMILFLMIFSTSLKSLSHKCSTFLLMVILQNGRKSLVLANLFFKTPGIFVFKAVVYF